MPADHVSDEIRDGAALLGLHLSQRHVEQLHRFHELLVDPGIARGVVAKGDRDRIVERHILDSLRAIQAIPEDARDVYDLGSGGGLPAVPIAVCRPSLAVTSVEPRRNRATFQELVAEEAGVANLRVRQVKAQALAELVDVCTARALAPLPECWHMATPLLRPGGRLVYFAGASVTVERPPGAAFFEILPAPALESSGALVIIGRP